MKQLHTLLLKLVFAGLLALASGCRSRENKPVMDIVTDAPPREDIVQAHSAENRALDTLFKVKIVHLINEGIYASSAHDHGLSARTIETPKGDTGTFVFDLGENMPTHFVTMYTFHVRYPSLEILVQDKETMKLVPVGEYDFK